MVIIRILLRVSVEEKEAFIRQLDKESEKVKSFTGCLRFQLFEDTSKPNHFLLYEEWQDRANFDAYRNSAAFKANGKILFPMMVGTPDSLYFEGESFT